MRFWLALTAIIPLFSFAGAVRASTQTDMEDCQQMQEVDRSIAGCSKLTADQSLAAPARAIAYFDRGLAYYARSDLDHAIADWSEAITLNPNYAHAYNNRAKAYRAKGDYANAIADYSQAIRLDPQHSVAYKGRGITYFLSGDAAKALADFRQAENIEPDAYTLLWLDLAARRNNQPFAIGAASKRVFMDEWPGPLVLMFGGQMTAHDVAVAAQNMDQKVTQGRLCDAYFYTGESMLLKNDKGQATSLFQHAVSSCPKTVDEYSSAAAELKALGKPVQALSAPGGEQKAESAKPSP
ncbi:MAG: tetratricopeptide repeat protein [Methylovirgula sp.]